MDKMKGIDLAGLEDYINNIINNSLESNDESYDKFEKSKIKKFVQSALNQSFGKNDEKPYDLLTNKNSSKRDNYPEPQIFNIHGYVIIRLQIPDGIDEKNIKVFLYGSKPAIKWHPDRKVQTLQLMTNITSKNSKAIIKDNILELRLQVDTNIKTEEIVISYL